MDMDMDDMYFFLCICVCLHMYVCCSHRYLNYKSSGVANPHTYAVYPPQVARAAEMDYKGVTAKAERLFHEKVCQ